MELEALQAILPQIEAAPASLLALSPSRPEFCRQVVKKLGLTFPILSDPDNLVAREFGLVFRVPETLQDVYLSFGIDLERHNGTPGWELPLPATYLVDRDGTIVYADVNVDHTHRMEPEELLSQLTRL